MANSRQATVLAEVRAVCAEIDDNFAKLRQLRARFDAFGGTNGFKGNGLLFDVDGNGQELPYDDFYGCFTGLGAMEGDDEFPSFLAVVQRARG